MSKENAVKPESLWQGRYLERQVDQSLEQFWNSLAFDRRLARFDVQGSFAHLQMLETVGILTEEQSQNVAKGLKTIQEELESAGVPTDASDEDIHSYIERRLTELIGADAGRLHTARSRNDQVALDLMLYCREQTRAISAAVRLLQKSLLEQAKKNLDLLMPGYTHLQKAQPVRVSHHLLAYFWKFQRDIERLSFVQSQLERSPLGAGALAGSTFAIDREQVAESLEFSGVTQNSLDTVSNRDFCLDLMYACSTIALHLSSLCEDLVIWNSGEFRFVTMPDTYSTGSSMMPQKKNPDLAELVRGKSGRVFGNLFGLLATLKGLPLSYNKDMQEDKEPLFDSVDTCLGSLTHMAGMIRELQFNEGPLSDALCSGYMDATDVADYLVTKGVPFRSSHAIVGAIVRHCEEKNCAISDLALAELQDHCDLIESDIKEVLDIEAIVDRRDSAGGTGRTAVEIQIEQAKKVILS